jgi:hypothetical protein
VRGVSVVGALVCQPSTPRLYSSSLICAAFLFTVHVVRLCAVITWQLHLLASTMSERVSALMIDVRGRVLRAAPDRGPRLCLHHPQPAQGL